MSTNDNGKKSFLTDLKEHPVKILALIYPYILIIGIGIGLFYLSKTNQVGNNLISPALIDTTTVQDLPLIKPSTAPAADIMSLSQPNDALVAKGKIIYTTNCVSCHGADGKGDGVAAGALVPKPRNFTSLDSWINGPKISGIFKTLSEGIKGSAMVAFDVISSKDKLALAQYIRKTFVPNPPEDSKDDLTDLAKKYKLSVGGQSSGQTAQGQTNPGQIPIKDAMVLVEQDSQEKYQKIIDVLKQISSDPGSGADIFNKVVDDKIKALTMLSSTDEWHNNEKVFVDLIVNELGQDGFNDKVHFLSDSDWDTFYNYMSKLL
ncbi:MAG: cytochrome c [Bacteroidetes bacterium]|nr:cytochrome c [Bacteroidota bacterium]